MEPRRQLTAYRDDNQVLDREKVKANEYNKLNPKQPSHAFYMIRSVDS